MEVREPSAKYLAGAAFKQTEVGLIPEDWECVQLTSVAVLESGHTPSRRHPEYWNGNIPWVSLHDTDALDGPAIFDTAQRVTEEGIKHSSARVLPEGTVVFSRTATVGKVTTLGQPMATSQDFANYICGSRVFNQYLVYLFRWMAPEWKKLMAGSTHNSVYMPTFKALRIPLPSRDEQEAIVAQLRDADALIESLEQLLVKKRQIKQGAMQELLTAQRRLPGFAGEWKSGCVGDVITGLLTGVSVNSAEQDSFSEVPSVLKTSALSSGKFRPEESKPIVNADLHRARCQPRRDSLLISRMNTPDLVGEVAYVEQDYDWLYLPDRIWMAKPRSSEIVCVRWLSYVLCSPEYKARIGDAATGTSGSMKNIAKSAFLGLSIQYPEVTEQTAIAQVLSDMDADIAAVETRLTKARAIKQGMMQELLTGQIRLVPPLAS